MQPVADRSWFGIIRESFAGAWQKNVEVKRDDVLGSAAVFRCVSLIASDVAKMRLQLMRRDKNDFWGPVAGPKRLVSLLLAPNNFQNRIQFIENWMTSKLIYGNTYALKIRDNARRVTRLHILHPDHIKPLVTDSGLVYYELKRDNLSGNPKDQVIVPASEIVHDRWNTLFHPLVGLSPIFACGLAATQGQKIQQNSAKFFANNSRPGGLLIAPGNIKDDNAKRIKDYWESEFSGDNAGKLAVLGDGLQYLSLAVTPVDSQLVEQLKWSAETVCSTFGVPAYKIGVGDPPTYANIEALDVQYYSQCLQIHIESLEAGLGEGLELEPRNRVEFNLDDLLRMDTSTLVKSEAEAVKAGFRTPNESRLRFNQKPVEGGDTPYLQQQNYSLAALDKRDQNPAPHTLSTQPAGTDSETEKADARRELRAALQVIQGGLRS